MGIALDRSSLWGTPPPMNPAPGFAPATSQEIPAREVVRCQECLLVQFRTISDHCRRCRKPLPSLVSLSEPEAQEAPEAGTGAEVGEMPLGRGARNRRMSVGSRVKAFRRQRSLTQMQMATLFKIPRSYLSRIENNRLLPGPLMVAQFAEALGVGVSELLPPEPSRQKAVPVVSDPATAALLKYFMELTPREMEGVLSTVRLMVGRVNPLTAADAPRESLQGQESRLQAARTEQAPSKARTPMFATAAAGPRKIQPASVGFPASARQASLRRLAR